MRAPLAALLLSCLAAAACNLLSGIDDLVVADAPGLGHDGGGGQLGQVDASNAPPGADSSVPPGDGSRAVDAGADGPYARNVTFEGASLTGPLGADSVSGAAAVTQVSPIAGTFSMSAGAAGSMVTVAIPPLDDVYIGFLVRPAAAPPAQMTVLRLSVAQRPNALSIVIAPGKEINGGRFTAAAVVAGGASSVSCGEAAVGTALQLLMRVRANQDVQLSSSTGAGSPQTTGTIGTPLGQVTKIEMGTIDGEASTVFDNLRISAVALTP